MHGGMALTWREVRGNAACVALALCLNFSNPPDPGVAATGGRYCTPLMAIPHGATSGANMLVVSLCRGGGAGVGDSCRWQSCCGCLGAEAVGLG